MGTATHVKSGGSLNDAGPRGATWVVWEWLALALGYVVALGVTARHLLYGVNVTDEGYHLALVYRFVRGDRPLISEYELHQFAALLEVPFMRAYLAWRGSTDGVVLAGRGLYFVLLLAAIGLVSLGLSDLLGWRWSLAVCLPLAFYAPMALPSVGYNSIATFAFLIFCVWGLRARVAGGGVLSLLVCGFFGGLTVFANPPWAAAAIPILVLFCVWLGQRCGWRGVGVLLAGFFVPMLALGLIVGRNGGLQQLTVAYRFTAAYRFASGPFGQVVGVMAHLGRSLRLWPLPILVACLAGFGMTRWPRARVVTVLAVPITLFAVVTRNSQDSWMWMNWFVMLGGVCAIPLWWAARREEHAVGVLQFLIVPGLVAAVAASYLSYIGDAVAGQGMLPAFLALMLVGVWLIQRALTSDPGPTTRETMVADASTLVWISVLSICLGTLMWGVTFNDSPPSQATSTVLRGPWRGLRTTEDHKQFVETLSTDLESLDARHRRVLVMYSLPGVYLAAQGAVTGPALWVSSFGADRRAEVSALESLPPPDIMVQDKLSTTPAEGEDPYAAYAAKIGFDVAFDRPWYRIYVRR